MQWHAQRHVQWNLVNLVMCLSIMSTMSTMSTMATALATPDLQRPRSSGKTQSPQNQQNQQSSPKLYPVFRNITFRDSLVRPTAQQMIRAADPTQSPQGSPQRDPQDSPQGNPQGSPRDFPSSPHDPRLIIQDGQIVPPDSDRVATDPDSSLNAMSGIQALIQAMNRGVDLAQDVLHGVCPHMNLRVAPLSFEDMGKSGTLMKVSAPFILMELGMHNIHQRMGHVFVPSGLVRGILANQASGSADKIVWTDSSGQVGYQPSAQEEAQLLEDLWQQVPHDVYITVNTRVNFAIGDSDCALVSGSSGYYSVVSTLVHELLHGAGVYSLIEPDRSGGLQGYASSFDALLKTTCTSCAGLDATAGCYLLDRQNLHHLTGNQVAGQTLCVNESRVFNPSTFYPGSSLSHFETPQSVMNSTIGHSTCRFELSQTDLKALTELGWTQCDLSATPHVWDTADTLLPKSLMLQLTNMSANASADHTAAPTHSGYSCDHHDNPDHHHHRRHGTVTYSVWFDEHCHTDPNYGWFVALMVFLFVCIVGCCVWSFLWPNECGTTYSWWDYRTSDKGGKGDKGNKDGKNYQNHKNQERTTWVPGHWTTKKQPSQPSHTYEPVPNDPTRAAMASNEHVRQLFAHETPAFVIE